jgi:hypothetical protein
MKIQNLFLTLIAAAAIMVGCNPKEEEQPSLPVLTVGQTEVSFEQGGGTASVTVTSNRPWTITSDADWLAFNPSNGTASSAPVNVTVTALANSSNDRTASFRVKTDFDYKTINVSQKGAKGEDTTDKPSGDGTKDNPYNPAGVVAYVNTLNADTDSPNVVYVTGKISEVSTTYEASGTYGNATFYISEDGSKTLTQFYVFQTYYLGNKKWKSGQTDVKVGDSVTICGKVVNYKGKTPETVGKGGSYVCTLNGTTEYGDGGGDQPEAKGKGTLEDPFNPSAAANAVADLTWTDSKNYQTTDNVYVKGKISRIAENGTYTEGGTYGNASFYIVEEGTDFEFYVFRALYLGNKKYASGQTDIKVGDEVVIYGKLMNYRGNTPETEAGSCYLYSLNNETGEGDQPGGDTEEVKTATIAEFLAAPDSKTQPYKLTGKVSNIKSDVYGNFDLTDASGTVYVYGLVSKDLGGYDQNKNKNDKSFASIGIKEGDEITIIGYRETYTPKEGDPVIEVVGSYYVSGASGSGGDTPDATAATVAEAIAAEKDAVLKVGPAVVVASSSAGFLMEQDGARIYVYGKTAVVGDNVTVTGTRAEYGGAPQLGSPTVTVNSKGAKVTYPTAKDITSTADSYSSNTREFVTVKGKLNISGNYFNINISGVTVIGSIVKPVEDIASLNGKDVTIKGYYLYHTSQGKYLYVIATDINGTAITGEGGGSQGGGDGDVSGGKITWTSSSAWAGVADKASEISLTAGTYKITAKKASGKTNPTVNGNANDCRVYANGSVTISTTGDAMTSIVFNISSQGLKRLAAITADTGTVATQSKGDKTVSWTGSAKSVTFTVGASADYGSDVSSSAFQFDFSSI